MNVLALDTSSEKGSVAITGDGEVLGEVRLVSSMQHSERLFRSIDFLFDHVDITRAGIVHGAESGSCRRGWLRVRKRETQRRCLHAGSHGMAGWGTEHTAGADAGRKTQRGLLRVV